MKRFLPAALLAFLLGGFLPSSTPFAVLTRALPGAAPLAAQVTPLPLPAPAPWMRPADAAVPYGPGERLTYDVKLGWFSVGDGHMTVVGMDSVRGHSTYHVRMGIKGGIPLARVDDTFESWIDTRTLASRRFMQDQNEVNYKRFRQFEFFPEEMRFERADVEEEGDLPTNLPLDDISFVYFVRTIPLVVGETYTYNRYFKDDGNPVVLKVVRKDQVTVPAGTFNTIVVKPVIQTRGLFGEGGEAELHFTDDSRRILVMMRSRVPVVGSLSLHLTSIEEGTSRRARRTAEDAEDPAEMRAPSGGSGGDEGDDRRDERDDGDDGDDVGDDGDDVRD